MCFHYSSLALLLVSDMLQPPTPRRQQDKARTLTGESLTHDRGVLVFPLYTLAAVKDSRHELCALAKLLAQAFIRLSYTNYSIYTFVFIFRWNQARVTDFGEQHNIVIFTWTALCHIENIRTILNWIQLASLHIKFEFQLERKEEEFD